MKVCNIIYGIIEIYYCIRSYFLYKYIAVVILLY